MLIHVDQRTQQPRRMRGEAQVVLTLDADGRLGLEAIFRGSQDCTYGLMSDERCLQRELPKLLAELRAQLSAAGSN